MHVHAFLTKVLRPTVLPLFVVLLLRVNPTEVFMSSPGSHTVLKPSKMSNILVCVIVLVSGSSLH